MSESENNQHVTRIKSKNQSFLKKDLTTLDFRKKRNVLFFAIILLLGLIAVGFVAIYCLVSLWNIL